MRYEISGEIKMIWAIPSNFIIKLKHFLLKSILMRVYFALIHSQFNYLTGLCYKKKIFVKFQFYKNIYENYHRHSTSDLFKNHSPTILNIENIYKLNEMKCQVSLTTRSFLKKKSRTHLTPEIAKCWYHYQHQLVL